MTAESTVQTNSAKDDAAGSEHTRIGNYYRPLVDIFEQSEELVIQADMPGVKQDAFDIDFNDGKLSIHGRVEPRQRPDSTYLLQEFDVGDFYRVFEVSEAIDASRITAENKDGVLVVHLPKAATVKPRKIAVQNG